MFIATRVGVTKQRGIGPHRYWRIHITGVQTASSPDDDVAEIADVYLRAIVGGTDQISGSGGTASADSFLLAGYEAAKAADNNSTTFWASGSTALPHWWQYDFGAGNAKTVGELVIVARNPTFHYIKDFELRYSDDGSTWLTAKSWTGQSFTNGESKYLPV